MSSVVQQLAERIKMSFHDFVGEMRKRGCSEPAAIKIWRGEYEDFNDFNDHDMQSSQGGRCIESRTGTLLPK